VQPRVAGRDAEQGEGRAVRPASALLPVAEGVNADSERRGGRRLAQPDTRDVPEREAGRRGPRVCRSRPRSARRFERAGPRPWRRITLRCRTTA